MQQQYHVLSRGIELGGACVGSGQVCDPNTTGVEKESHERKHCRSVTGYLEVTVLNQTMSEEKQ